MDKLFPISSSLWDTGGNKLKKMLGLTILVIVLLEYSAVTEAAGAQAVKYLYYLGDNRITNWTEAVDKCDSQGGELTYDIDIDDWELLFGKSTVFLDDNYFWIGLKRDSNMDWKWLDGTDLDLNTTASFPLRPEFQSNITWDCVQWNVKEPFYVPQDCDVPSPFICRIPNAVCGFHTQGKLEVNMTLDTVHYKTDVNIGADSIPVYLAQNLSLADCQEECFNYTDSNMRQCWLYEYEASSSYYQCKLVISDGKPVLISLKTSTTQELFAKYCVEVEKFTHCKDGEECLCGNVTSNPSPQQLEAILEETKERLTVPTKNLSATIRKKTSAADERPSSQTMGYFGITMITVTIGGLVLLDCTSMLRDLKIMMYNLRCVTSGNRDLPPPKMLQVNLQGGPKSSYA